MIRECLIAACVSVLVQYASTAAIQTESLMTVHWLHDKTTGRVAIDVSVGHDSFSPISRQLCGPFSKQHTIDWDGFADNPLLVSLDDTGNGSIAFQGQTYDTVSCPVKWNDRAVVLECQIPYRVSLRPVLPSSQSPSCRLEVRGLASLSPIHKKSIAETHLLRCEMRDRQQVEVRTVLADHQPQSTTKKRSPQGSRCITSKCTILHNDGAPITTSKQVQLTSTLDCRDGACSIESRSKSDSQVIRFFASSPINRWNTGGFDTVEKYRTKNSLKCPGQPHQTICVWTSVPHVSYEVQNAQCSTCGNALPHGEIIRVLSPMQEDHPYCVRNTCRTKGEGYFPVESNYPVRS